METKFKTKELLKYNSKVQSLKEFIDQNIKPDDIPEDFIKEHFKDEHLIKEIQDAVEAEHGQHVYACKIIKYLIKHAAKTIERMSAGEEVIPSKKSEFSDVEDDDYYETGIKNHHKQFDGFDEVDKIIKETSELDYCCHDHDCNSF